MTNRLWYIAVLVMSTLFSCSGDETWEERQIRRAREDKDILIKLATLSEKESIEYFKEEDFSRWESIPEGLRTPAVWQAILDRDLCEITEVPKERLSREMVLAVFRNPDYGRLKYDAEYLPEWVWNDPECAEVAFLKSSESAIPYIPLTHLAELSVKEGLSNEVARERPEVIDYLPEEIRVEVAKEVIEGSRWRAILDKLPSWVWEDASLVEASYRVDHYDTLRRVHKAGNTDILLEFLTAENVWAVVERNPQALLLLPEELRTAEVYQRAVLRMEFDERRVGFAPSFPLWESMTPEIREALIEEVMSVGKLVYLPFEYRGRDRCLRAVKQGASLQDVPFEHRDLEMCHAALERSNDAWEHVPKRFLLPQLPTSR